MPLCATESHLCHFVPRSLICAILCHGVPFVPFCATEFHLCHNAQKRPEEIQHQLGFLPAGICKSIPYLINLPCCFPYSRNLLLCQNMTPTSISKKYASGSGETLQKPLVIIINIFCFIRSQMKFFLKFFSITWVGMPSSFNAATIP